MNLSGELYIRLKGGPCRTFTSDLRLAVKAGTSYTYPDVAVICGVLQYADGVFDTVLNPTVIIEILSPSTESWDRGGKFDRYRTIDSLQEYVLISQDRRLVERFSRGQGEWAPTSWSREDEVLTLDSIGCNVPLLDIYRDVQFDAFD
jgi:Uma2 family endonuclease